MSSILTVLKKESVMNSYEQLKTEVVRRNDFSSEFNSVKRIIRWNRFSIAIENEQGDYRKWVDPQGKSGKTFMNFPYGFIISQLRGHDGDSIDVYIGPDKNSAYVFVVTQLDPKTGQYDEDKVMLGFTTAKQAVAAYQSQYNSPKFFGGVSTYWIDDFEHRVTRKCKSIGYERGGCYES